MNKTSTSNPRHIAIIMDGNGRWAQSRGLPRAAGHQSGFKVTRRIVESCGKRQIDALTMFAFSSENWQRPATEVSLLMDLFLRALKSEVESLHANNVHMRFIGERSAFSEKLQHEMAQAETTTSNNDGLKLAIAVNYGGRWDIVEAAKRLLTQVSSGDLSIDELSVEKFGSEVSISDVGEPDLFIRTGGEQRISNYLLWQLAYTELYFTDALWPDFNDDELDKAIQFFLGRQRRFGKTGAQVDNKNA